jgi:hypothetical protein
MSMWNRTRDLSDCIAVPKPVSPPPKFVYIVERFTHIGLFVSHPVAVLGLNKRNNFTHQVNKDWISYRILYFCQAK